MSMSDFVKDREESKEDPGDESKEDSGDESKEDPGDESKENSDDESKEEGEESKEGEQSKELPELWSGMLDEVIPEDMLDGVTPEDLSKDTGCGDEDFEKIFGGSLDDEKDGDSLNEDSSDEEED
jgi:hypothetical protein